MVNHSGGFTYLEKGKGKPIILLHGLMGGVENFGDMVDFISNDYKVYGLDLKLFETPFLKCSVKSKAEYLLKFMNHLGIEKASLLGNSMGGHIGLIFTKLHPGKVNSLLLTGSSGLYESSMGDTFPRRGDYDYIKRKTEEVFYDPEVATKDLVDRVFDIAGRISQSQSASRYVSSSRGFSSTSGKVSLNFNKSKLHLSWNNSDCTPLCFIDHDGEFSRLSFSICEFDESSKESERYGDFKVILSPLEIIK